MTRLIARFHDVDGGQIRIGGVPVTDLTEQDRMQRLSLVFQEVQLSHDTVRANIALGRGQATDEEIEEAARAACIHDRIMQLPEGYDTVIGEDAHLSGGEAQRLTIARAFLSEPALLILDEATSSVDTRTELLLQQAMAALRAGRTSFVIAHRLSTIRDADLILVMKDGAIVEQGTHCDLLAAKGHYYDLYQSQFNAPAGREATA